MRTPLKLTLVAAAFAAAGCATLLSPEAERLLEEARASHRFASEDPRVQRYAAAELASASAALREAERLAAEGGSAELVEHNAYLAERRSRTALGTAQIRQAEADIAAAREERRRAQLEARERETAAARARAEQAEIARREAELARREAEMRTHLMTRERLEKEKVSLAATELAAEVKRLETELADVRAKQTERGWILTLKNELLFDSGGATLKPGAQRALDNLAQFLRKHPERDIAIEGFTDSFGSPDSNQRLSERRAQAVKDGLIGRGIESRRIDARGYGPSFPVASNATETGRQLNRRVEIVINPS
jgi:outer membrane protein OmpA-like peptidoglycan-associated protein